MTAMRYLCLLDIMNESNLSKNKVAHQREANKSTDKYLTTS